MELGNKIRQLRYRTSMTQEQLAEKLSVSSQAVSKWENSAAMPDISLLPALAETFGVTIDDLFDLTREQKLNRIENRMETEEELEPDVFREYEDFLKQLTADGEYGLRAKQLMANLHYHRLAANAAKVSTLAREAIAADPAQKECQWLLIKAEGAAAWDWNFKNHTKTIEFYKQVIANDHAEKKAIMPYFDVIDNLLADRRADEAEEYLKEFTRLTKGEHVMTPVYEAHIALARFDEKKADAIIEKALEDRAGDHAILFEAAQYYACKCDYDRAIELYEAAYAADEPNKPRFTDALDAIAQIHEIRGEYRQAAETYGRVLENLRTEWGMTDENMVKETEREIERLMKISSF